MSSVQSKRIRMFVFLAVCAGAPMLTWHTQSRGAAVQSQPSSSGAERIHALRVERRDVLRQSVAFLDVLFMQGRISTEQLADARMELHNAELDLCANTQERIHVREQMVESLRWCENKLEAATKAGRAIQSDFIRLKARRLKAEIELEQARM